jgi:hypothetical protein
VQPDFDRHGRHEVIIARHHLGKPAKVCFASLSLRGGPDRRRQAGLREQRDQGQARQQASNNTKEQFANSPDLKSELLNAIMGALDAHTAMSRQALNSPTVQSGMKDILLNYAGLWEALRERAMGPPGPEAKT